MPQHDMVIDNGPGLTVRTDMNAAIQALATCSSGPIEPTTKYAGQLWFDTTVAPNGLLRQRNQANTDWMAAAVLPATAGNIAVSVVTTSGTYTKPAGLRFLEVYCIGGGGGGGVAAAATAGQSSAGGGGGAGGVAYKLYKAADVGATVAYVIGAGGAGGTTGGVEAGRNGTGSTFAGLTGGAGFGGNWQAAQTSVGIAAAGGGGGNATGGDLNLPGTNGDAGIANPHGRVGTYQSGGGGGNFFVIPDGLVVSLGNGPGSPGRFPGGGGGGAATGGAGTSIQTGGAGAAGCIILKEYF